jgi:hypothetical protein
MPTDKHRIAAYLPPEVDEKFQAFKHERGVGDSQALILILSEFLEVSHQVSHSSLLSIEALKSELLSELDIRFDELKSELLGGSLKSVVVTQESLKDVKISHDSLVDVKVSHQGLKALELESEFIECPTIAQLSKRFGCDAALVRKQKSKYRDEPEKFIAWSKSRDPEGRGWKFDEEAKLFALVGR